MATQAPIVEITAANQFTDKLTVHDKAMVLLTGDANAISWQVQDRDDEDTWHTQPVTMTGPGLFVIEAPGRNVRVGVPTGGSVSGSTYVDFEARR